VPVAGGFFGAIPALQQPHIVERDALLDIDPRIGNFAEVPAADPSSGGTGDGFASTSSQE
jgi:hypothetical protein